jgi:hypothetical protein
MPGKREDEARTSPRPNPFVFIVGCARSGTTLLQRIVNAHPQIAITPEIHWITNSFKEGTWLGPQGRVTREQVTGMATHKRFRQFEFSREQFEELVRRGEAIPYTAFLDGLFALYGKLKNKQLVGNKTPPYVQRIRKLHALWPQARFVHLIRDGRDVCLSVLNWDHACSTAGAYATWAEDRVSTAALWWERKVRLGRQEGRALRPGLYYEIRYEDLVARPAQECAKLCAFLGVPYDDAMLYFHEAPPPPYQGNSHPWRPITPGMRDWRSQMSAADVERFEAVSGDLLDELGYPRAVASPSPASRGHAARLRDCFSQEAFSRKDALPAGWSKRLHEEDQSGSPRRTSRDEQAVLEQ